MFAVSDPDLLVAQIALGGLAAVFFWRLINWVRDAPTRSDPWDAATEQKLSAPEAVEVCHRCFAEQPDHAWFCRHCGGAVGPYNNLMPYVCIFSEGEVFRNGVSGRVRRSPLTVAGYVLLSLVSFGLFAPIFWLSFFKPSKGKATSQPSEENG